MAEDVKAQNHSSEHAPIKRDERGRILPGQRSNNPNGRKSLRTMILEETNGDGLEIVEFFLATMRGHTPDGRKARVSESEEAGKWLADRVWGKAVETTVLLGLEGGAAVAAQLNPTELVTLANTYSGLIAARTAAPAAQLPEVIDVTPEPKK